MTTAMLESSRPSSGESAGADMASLFAHSPMLFVNVVNAAIIASVLWGVMSPSLLLCWLILMTALVSMRLATARRFQRDPSALTTGQWARRHMLGSLATGLAWGTTGAVPLLIADPAFHVLVAITAAGMGAGALMLSFTHLPSFRAFTLGHGLPVVLGFALHGGVTYLALAAMGLVFFGVLDSIAQRLNDAHRRTRALQAQLVAGEQRMRDFAEAASHWLWETDSDGRFTMVSDGVARVIGVPPSHFIGRRPGELSADEPERQRVVDDMHRRIAAREAFMDVTLKLTLPDLRAVWLTISGRPIFDANGRFRGYRGTTRDVTAQRTAERLADEMRRARDVAAAADELKTRFLASVSHELRTPLNAVIGFSEMMAREMFGPIGSARYRDYASNINESGRHLLDLINDLLDMSRVELGHRRLDEETVTLGEIIAPCVEMVRGTIRAGSVAIDDDALERDVALRIDRRAIRQVIINLLSNAVRVSPAGATVAIASEPTPGGGLRLTVTDDGPGIPAAEREALFRPFSGVDVERPRRHGDTGLGLWISRSLVEALGGTLTLEDAEGGGTRAAVDLPPARVAADGADQAAAGTTAVASISTRA